MKKLITTILILAITTQSFALAPELATSRIQFRPGFNWEMAKVIREWTKKEDISEQGLGDILEKYYPVWDDLRIEELRRDIEASGMSNFTFSSEYVEDEDNKLYRHSNGLAVVEKTVKNAKTIRKFFAKRANKYCVPTFFERRPRKVYELYLGDMGYVTVHSIARLTPEDEKLLRNAIWTTFGNGYCHNHLHDMNILVIYENGIKDIKFIDWKYLNKKKLTWLNNFLGDDMDSDEHLGWLEITEDGKYYFDIQTSADDRKLAKRIETYFNKMTLEVDKKYRVRAARVGGGMRIEVFDGGTRVSGVGFDIDCGKLTDFDLDTRRGYRGRGIMSELLKCLSMCLPEGTVIESCVSNIETCRDASMFGAAKPYDWKVALGDTIKAIGSDEKKKKTVVAIDKAWLYHDGMRKDALNPLMPSLKRYMRKHNIELQILEAKEIKNADVAIVDEKNVKLVKGRDTRQTYRFAVDSSKITNEMYLPVVEIITTALRLSVEQRFIVRHNPLFDIVDTRVPGDDIDLKYVVFRLKPAASMAYEEMWRVYQMQKFA